MVSVVNPSVAQSNVDVIEHCLATPPEEHVWEVAEEAWFGELGERPACYLAMTTQGPTMAFVSAMMAWRYRCRQVRTSNR